MGLLQKCIQAQIPDAYIHLIHSYLTDRHFRVKHEHAQTDWTKIKAGVPQGSVLAPTLYNIFTSDIPTSRQTKIAQYADDTAIYSTKENIQDATRTLQTHINIITRWFSKWRIKLNTDKTEAIIFTRRRPRDINNITIRNTELQYKDKVKYLGIILDKKKLHFQEHFKYIRGKSLTRIRQIYPVINTQALTLRQKTTIYKSLIRPTILYASPAWGYMTKAQTQTLQAIRWRLSN